MLMQATFKGWMDIMKHAIDSLEVSFTAVMHVT